MRIDDPSRPHLSNTLPCWTTAPLVALPQLCFAPATDYFQWKVSIMIGGSWKSTTLYQDNTPSLLSDWISDPEECCRQWFKCEPPTTHRIAWDFSGEPAADADPSKIGF